MDDNDRWTTMDNASSDCDTFSEEHFSVVKPGRYEGGQYFDRQNECITESGYFQTKMLKEPATEGRGMD